MRQKTEKAQQEEAEAINQGGKEGCRVSNLLPKYSLNKSA